MTKATDQSYIDEVMGFNPSEIGAFHEPEAVDYAANIYKTNPAKSKSTDGRYHSRVRILYNPLNPKMTIVKQATYAMNDADGFFMVRSKLANNDRSCPIFSAWKRLWFSGDEAKKAWAREMFDKTESQWVLVQVIEDENQPEKVGKILTMKLPKAIFDKMSERMNPTTGKAPQPLTDPLIGRVLEMNVQPGPEDDRRRTSYTLCDFEEDATPIIKIDGTQLFNDEELEQIDDYAKAKAEIGKAKTEAKKAAAEKKVAEMTASIKELYRKAIDYLRENTLNLEEECAYREWDAETSNRVNKWLAAVSNMQDPKNPVAAPAVAQTGDLFNEVASESAPATSVDDDDLPF